MCPHLPMTDREMSCAPLPQCPPISHPTGTGTDPNPDTCSQSRTTTKSITTFCRTSLWESSAGAGSLDHHIGVCREKLTPNSPRFSTPCYFGASAALTY